MTLMIKSTLIIGTMALTLYHTSPHIFIRVAALYRLTSGKGKILDEEKDKEIGKDNLLPP